MMMMMMMMLMMMMMMIMTIESVESTSGLGRKCLNCFFFVAVRRDWFLAWLAAEQLVHWRTISWFHPGLMKVRTPMMRMFLSSRGGRTWKQPMKLPKPTVI